MPKQTYKTFENTDSGANEIAKQADEALQKVKFQDQKKKFNAKIDELANQAAEFYKAYGEDDWRTSLLVNFLDLSLQMKDIIEVVTAFNLANEIIFHALGLMNTSLNMTNGMMLEVGQGQPSPFKQKMMMRRALRNNRNTVKNMIMQMKTSIEMASLTADMYQNLSFSISKIITKMNGKRERNKKRQSALGSNSANMSSASARGMDMVKNIVSGGSAQPSAAAPTAPTAPAAPAAPSSSVDSGLDGVL